MGRSVPLHIQRSARLTTNTENSAKRFLIRNAPMSRFPSATKYLTRNVKKASKTSVRKPQRRLGRRLPNIGVSGLSELSRMIQGAEYRDNLVMYSIVLYSTALYSAILYSTLLYCIEKYSTVQIRRVQYCYKNTSCSQFS